jgi:hypothetical protein
VNLKQLRRYIYASDAHLMCHFFQLKHGETGDSEFGCVRVFNYRV